jgi:hypothetical protein
MVIKKESNINSNIKHFYFQKDFSDNLETILVIFRGYKSCGNKMGKKKNEGQNLLGFSVLPIM